MNILTFDYEYPPLGGGGGVVHALIAEQLARRHRIHVITSAFKDLHRHEVREGVEIHRVPVIGRKERSVATLRSMLSYPVAAWAVAARLMRKEKFDVVNSHFAVPTGPGSLPPARIAGIPHVLSIHGGDIYDPSKRLSPHRLPVVRSVVTWLLRYSDAVVAASSNTRENTYRYYKYRGQIEVIPLGIRQPKIAAAPRSVLGLPTDGFLAVTVGRLIKRKALHLLLRALTRPGCSDVHLAIVGEGPERQHLEPLAKELGIEKRVIFLGRVDDTRKWQTLQCADAYVSATQHEGFGLVYLEAMVAGLPIVTFDHGGQVDFLRDGETGYLVSAGDEPGLGAAIARLASHPEEVRRFRQTNLKKAKQHHIEECAARYEALFEDLVARTGSVSESRQRLSHQSGSPSSDQRDNPRLTVPPSK